MAPLIPELALDLERPVTELTISIVGEEESNVLWEGDLLINEVGMVQGGAPIAGALEIRAIREGRTFTLGPAGYIAPDLDTHHRFVLKADRSIDHMVATGIIPEWRLFQTYDGPHERPPVLAGHTK